MEDNEFFHYATYYARLGENARLTDNYRMKVGDRIIVLVINQSAWSSWPNLTVIPVAPGSNVIYQKVWDVWRTAAYGFRVKKLKK